MMKEAKRGRIALGRCMIRTIREVLYKKVKYWDSVIISYRTPIIGVQYS